MRLGVPSRSAVSGAAERVARRGTVVGLTESVRRWLTAREAERNPAVGAIRRWLEAAALVSLYASSVPQVCLRRIACRVRGYNDDDDATTRRSA